MLDWNIFHHSLHYQITSIADSFFRRHVVLDPRHGLTNGIFLGLVTGDDGKEDEEERGGRREERREKEGGGTEGKEGKRGGGRKKRRKKEDSEYPTCE